MRDQAHSPVAGRAFSFGPAAARQRMTFSEDHVGRAYGGDAAEALEALSHPLEELFRHHSVQVTEQLRAAASRDAVLRHLTDDERRDFENREAHHVLLLASAQLTQEEHAAAALEIGRAHALIGADMLWRLEAFCRLQEAAVRLIGATLRIPEQRDRRFRRNVTDDFGRT